MATSYDNPNGKGNRQTTMGVSRSAIASFVGDPMRLIDGSYGSAVYWYGNVADQWLRFDFPGPVIMDEATLYQGGGDNHGTWRWEGSNDGVTWDQFETFTWVGSNCITPLTNTTPYTSYRLHGVSGFHSSGPYINEFDFKVSEVIIPEAVRSNQTVLMLLTRGTAPLNANQTVVLMLAKISGKRIFTLIDNGY